MPRVAKALGAPTCLVNNASEFLLDTVANVSDETWSTHQDINLKVPVFLARQLFLNLPAGETGNVINIIDQRVWKLTPDFFSYTISKAGLWTATRTLAQALAPRVRVNAIGPGPVLKSVHQTDADFAAEVQSTLLKRGPTPRRSRRRGQLHPRGTGHDRADDRARRRPAFDLVGWRDRPKHPEGPLKGR